MHSRQIILALTACAIALPADAQRTSVERRAPRVAFGFGMDSDRAMLGISTSSSGERDTLGLLITSIVPDGPADKAGLEEGNRIAKINDVDLTLAAADAGERDMRGMVSRRLTRELSKLEAGAEVELRVWADGRYRNVKVKTVAADEMPGRRRRSAEDRQDRAVLGVNVSASGTVRDTLGILIVRVAPNSPAERAGLVEGNRIAAIGNVDLRVARGEAEDGEMSAAKVNRFTREMASRSAGDEVELRVWADGQFRTMRVKAGKASDVYEEGSWSFITSDGAGVLHMPAPPIPPMPPRVDRLAPFMERHWHWQSEELEDAPVPGTRITAAPAAAPIARAAAMAGSYALPGQALPFEFDGGGYSVVLPPDDGDYEQRLGYDGSVIVATASGERYRLSLPGLRLSKVNDELAAYFGPGSELGLLVLEAEPRWSPLRAGDVILEINGKAVRDGDRARVRLDTDDENRLLILREKKRRTITVDG